VEDKNRNQGKQIENISMGDINLIKLIIILNVSDLNISTNKQIIRVDQKTKLAKHGDAHL
jgi:hypothetical protein